MPMLNNAPSITVHVLILISMHFLCEYCTAHFTYFVILIFIRNSKLLRSWGILFFLFHCTLVANRLLWVVTAFRNPSFSRSSIRPCRRCTGSRSRRSSGSSTSCGRTPRRGTSTSRSSARGAYGRGCIKPVGNLRPLPTLRSRMVASSPPF